MASDSTATVVNPGLAASIRNPWRMSCQSVICHLVSASALREGRRRLRATIGSIRAVSRFSDPFSPSLFDSERVIGPPY
jgi:hypothetical protein